MLGQNVAQRRDDRIDSAIFCTGLWHNIFNIGRSRIVSHTRNRVTSKYHAHILPLSALKYFISVVDHSKTHAFIVIKSVYFSQENLKAKEIMGI